MALEALAVEVGKETAKELTKALFRRLMGKLAHGVPSDFIRKVTCYNQGKVLEFWYHLGNYCKQNEKVEEIGRLQVGSEVKITREEAKLLDKEIRELMKYRENLLAILLEVYKENKNYILEYFKLRGKLYGRDETSPRVTIKVFVEENKVDYLLKDFFPNNALSKPFHVEENTAIEKVFDNQGYRALINDIPGFYEHEKRVYKNPRLDSKRVLRYSTSLVEKIKIGLHRKLTEKVYVDRDWKNCWIDGNETTDNAFYKSTMIIPMTLINNRIGEEFRRYLGIFLTSTKEEYIRAIYGFLCFDSVYTDFFDDTDEDMGYFFADIFSLYLVPFRIKRLDLTKVVISNRNTRYGRENEK